MKPLVSVIIPTYNRVDMLGASIESVLAQTYPEIEIVVVDDCSTDGTKALVASKWGTTARVKYHRQDRNLGGNAARNTGLKLSAGDLSCFLDSDDLFRPEKVERQVASLEETPSAGACVCQAAIFNETPGDTNQVWNRLAGDHPLLRYAANDVVWATAAPLWRREALDQVGPWDESLAFHQDLDFHLRALAGGVSFVTIPDVLLDYRDSASGTITAGSKRRKEGIRVLLDIYERSEGIARERKILDVKLRTSFATTYLWCAIVAARMREGTQIGRALAALKRVDPSPSRRVVAGSIVALASPAIYALRTGAKPLVDHMGSLGLPWHRWHFTHTLEEVAGKGYSGPMSYP